MFLPTDRSVQFPNRYQLAPVSGTDNIADLTPAPGEVSDPGTLWNRQAARQMQADLRTLPIAPGYSVSAGDVVDVSGGQVVKTVEAAANVENVIKTTAITDTAVCYLNSAYSVIVYTISNAVYARLIDNSTGAAVVSEVSVYSGAASYLSLARLSDTQFVVSYTASNGGFLVIGSVSDTTISFGNAYAWGSGGPYSSPPGVIKVSDGKIFIVEKQVVDVPSVTGVVFGYSGTTIQLPALGATDLKFKMSDASMVLLPDDASGNHRVCVCFSDSGDSNKGKAVIATIDSSNAVTWGDVVTFEESSSDAISCAENAGIVLVSYVSGSSTNVVALSISGTSISVSDKLSGVYASDAEDTSICAVGSSFVLSLQSGGYCFAIQYSNGKISSGARYSFNGDSQAKYPSAAPVSPSQFIVAYADNGNSSYGTTTTLEVMGTQIAGSFTDESSTAIALQSGTAGQSIECIFSGTTNASFVTEGQVIDSSGVYGVGIMDGILQVWSKERPGQVVTGSYVGTGATGSGSPNNLTFPFIPKILIISTNDTNKSYAGTIFINPQTESSGFGNQYQTLNSSVTISWGKTVSWYDYDDDEAQYNRSGVTYCYVAFS